MIENIADKMERARRLGNVADTQVCLEMDLWMRPDKIDIEWSVWDGRKHYHGPTLEVALRAAEHAWGLSKGDVPEAVLLPDAGDEKVLPR